MNARLCAMALAGLVLWGTTPEAAAQTDASKAAVTACEAEVTETVHQMRARPTDSFDQLIQFQVDRSCIAVLSILN